VYHWQLYSLYQILVLVDSRYRDEILIEAVGSYCVSRCFTSSVFNDSNLASSLSCSAGDTVDQESHLCANDAKRRKTENVSRNGLHDIDNNTFRIADLPDSVLHSRKERDDIRAKYFSEWGLWELRGNLMSALWPT
jgi:hypothetical protein